MKILIADNDGVMSDLLETVLIGLEKSADVMKASGMTEALQVWRDAKPELLVVDWDLADGTGLEFIQKVRAHDKAIPIVMITGKVDRRSIVMASRYNIAEYISKPFRVDAIQERLRKVLPVSTNEPNAKPLPEILAENLSKTITMPSLTDAVAVLELMARVRELSVAQLAERWRNDGPLCARILEVANRASFRRSGDPVNSIRDAIALMGIPMALNQALASALNIHAHLSSNITRTACEDYEKLAGTVAEQAQRVAFSLGRTTDIYFTAGLLSRVGEQAVLLVIDQHMSSQSQELTEEQIQHYLREWSAQYGNRLKLQWRLPLSLRELIGAVHWLPSQNLTRGRVLMRVGGLMAGGQDKSPECERLLRLLGLNNG